MVDWLDADFSDQSDSSDEEFVFHEEDVANDTSSSSEEEVSDVDRSTTTNQNTPQHTYGNHTETNMNGSAATYNDPRYPTPTNTPLVNGNGHGLDEKGHTNGKIGASRHRQEHHPHLYNPYGRTSPRRSNGERVDGNDSYSSYEYIRSLPYTEQINRPLGELGAPFDIFTTDFNQFHVEQESMLRHLTETGQEKLQMNTILEEEIESVKEECNNLKNEYRDICNENKQIREYIEDMHNFLLPYFNNIFNDEEEGADDVEGEENVKEVDADKNNTGDEDCEEKDDDESGDELDEVTLGPFLIELAHQFAQPPQQPQQPQPPQQPQEAEQQ